MAKVFSTGEIAAHNSEGDCWIVVDGAVFDVTHFLSEHPGGKKVLLKEGGKDTTKKFWLFHDPSILTKYAPKLQIGFVEGSKAAKAVAKNPSAAMAADPMDIFKVKASSVSMSKNTKKIYGDLVPYGDPGWYQRFNSPYYNDSHRKWRDFIRKGVEKMIMPFVSEWEESTRVPPEAFKFAGQMGFLAASCGMAGAYEYVPELKHLKPEKFDHFHEFIGTDEMCRCGSSGVVWGLLAGIGIGLPPILNFGSKQLKERIVRPVLLGEKIICLAISEPSAGSDVFNLQCTAKKSDCGKFWIVNGSKKWITNGTFADYFTTAVKTGKKGELTFMLIERVFEGVETRHMKCQGAWASGTAFITFDNVRVPIENQIGKENKGFKLIMYNFNHERWALALQGLRFARVCYEDSFRYALKRETFGKPLIKHQAIRFKLMNMARQIESLQAMCENVTHQLNTFPHALAMIQLGDVCALLKVQSSQVLEYCAREAVHIFGGAGYVRSGVGERVERIYRDVRSISIPGGAEEILTDFAGKAAEKMAKMSAKL